MYVKSTCYNNRSLLVLRDIEHVFTIHTRCQIEPLQIAIIKRYLQGERAHVTYYLSGRLKWKMDWNEVVVTRERENNACRNTITLYLNGVRGINIQCSYNKWFATKAIIGNFRTKKLLLGHDSDPAEYFIKERFVGWMANLTILPSILPDSHIIQRGRKSVLLK
jgi:hypothetical protein